MDEAEALSQVIGVIYDAALDEGLWPAALEASCRFVHTMAAAVFVQNAALRTGVRFHSWGDDAPYTRLYFSEYVKINPLVPLMMLQEVGQVFSVASLMPYDEFLPSRFCKEWVEPQGLVDLVGINVEKSGTNFASVTMGRDRALGLVDDAARQRMALIAPHLRRAVLIGNVIDIEAAEAAAFTATFDGLAAAVFLVGTGGRIVFANMAAQAMLAAGVPLRGRGGVLSAAEAQADHALREVFAVSGEEDGAVGVKGIAMPLNAAPGERWIAHVLPLTSGARKQAGIAHDAAAAVFVRKAELDLPTPAELMTRLYKLTPRELRVLYAAVQSGGIAATAETLGLSEATVKTHLQHLFEKTGTSRQADLVKLVVTHSSPFAR